VLVARTEVGDGTVTEHDGGVLPIRTGGLDQRVADNCRGHLRGGRARPDGTDPGAKTDLDTPGHYPANATTARDCDPCAMPASQKQISGPRPP
jgi:hypothetical protein